MATPSQVTVDDPTIHSSRHEGDGHAGEEPMLLGHDGQMHPSNLQHFFVSSEQQFEASKLGMWLFLATEILLFGGMFVAYGIFRVLYPELYEAASLQLDTVLGATNTLVLLLSSLTMAWAIRGAQMDNRKVLIGNLVATMVLASGFLVVKYFEYSHKFHEGIWPGVNFELNEDTPTVADLDGAVALTPIFTPPQHGDDTHDTEVVESDAGTMVSADAPLTGPDQATPPAADADIGDVLGGAVQSEASRAGIGSEPGELARSGLGTEHGDVDRAEGKEAIFHNRRAGIFFSIYYVMTGIHAIHIVIGIIAIGFLTFFASRGRYSSVWYTPVENVGLYWHIVDIIWIFVFPLMYLI